MALSKKNVAVTVASVLVAGLSTTLLFRHSSRRLPDPFGEELKPKVPGASLPLEAVEFLGKEGETDYPLR